MIKLINNHKNVNYYFFDANNNRKYLVKIEPYIRKLQFIIPFNLTTRPFRFELRYIVPR